MIWNGTSCNRRQFLLVYRYFFPISQSHELKFINNFRFAGLPTSVTTVTVRLDPTAKMCLLQTTGIGTRCVSCATCATNLYDQRGNLPFTRTKYCVMTATSLTSRRRVKVVRMRSNQEARVSNTMGLTGMKSASNVRFAKRPLGPAALFQRKTSSTVPTAIRICTLSAVPSAANRWLKAVSFTTNKRGTKSALVVTAAMSRSRLVRFRSMEDSGIALSATEGIWPNSASCVSSR